MTNVLIEKLIVIHKNDVKDLLYIKERDKLLFKIREQKRGEIEIDLLDFYPEDESLCQFLQYYLPQPLEEYYVLDVFSMNKNFSLDNKIITLKEFVDKVKKEGSYVDYIDRYNPRIYGK